MIFQRLFNTRIIEIKKQKPRQLKLYVLCQYSSQGCVLYNVQVIQKVHVFYII